MKGVIVKAPAKLVITGDYSALYNGKSITCAINNTFFSINRLFSLLI